MRRQRSSPPHACSRVQRNERRTMGDPWDALLKQAEANREQAEANLRQAEANLAISNAMLFHTQRALKVPLPRSRIDTNHGTMLMPALGRPMLG